MLSSAFSPWRSVLSPQAALEVANGHLENGRRARNPEMALTYCCEAEIALSRIKRSARRTHTSSSRAEDRVLCSGIASTYFELSDMMDILGHHDKAQASYTNGEKWGARGRKTRHSSDRPNSIVSLSDSIASLSDSIASLSTASHDKDPMVDASTDLAASPSADPAEDPSVAHLLGLPPLLTPPLTQESQGCNSAQIPRQFFAKDIHQPLDINKLPKSGERLESISQLVHCLELLQSLRSPDDALDQVERNWLAVIEDDTDEQERLRTVALNMLREFAYEGLKDARTVAEIVCVVPVLEKDDLQQLLQQLFHGIEQSEMLDFNLINGLAQLVQSASPGHLNADNLVKILELISARLRGTHQQSPDYIYQLTLTVSHVLDAMADSDVQGLDRETLHAPLAAYLHRLESNTDPYLVYQAAYASQALLYVPDDETIWQAAVRRTGRVVRGVSGIVSAVKGLDLNRLVEGLSDIQEAAAAASEVFSMAKIAVEDVVVLAKSGQQFLVCLQEGLSFSRKRAWYPALRGADILLRNGKLIEFGRLVCEAPCRSDPAFQWGVCERLGDIADNPECDDDSRESAVAFLGEMYQNDAVWGQQSNVKQWILDILMHLAESSGSPLHVAETLLKELEKTGDAKKQALHQSCREEGPSPHPLKVTLPPPLSQSLLDRVQNKLDVEASLRQLRERRLNGRGETVYISPQAKANIKARDDVRFPLMDKVKEFLDSDRKVFLLLGDSGAGKSSFNQHLECYLWSSYKKKDGRIPLFITLAAIQNPEDDLIGKQLRKEGFTEHQIRELKGYREFILICDGYDESRQTHNLYTSNRLNQLGEWHARMVISCRTEYLGSDYRDRFQPVDRNHQAESPLFQEAAIAPFSKGQIEDYVKQFVCMKGLKWQADDYLMVLNRIQGLKDLVTNPFLLTLSLEVLPRMVDPGGNLSGARVTRVMLYDQFVEQWLERGKIRLVEKVSEQDRGAFESLSDEGFTQQGIAYLKSLATAIFEKQSGNSVVEYSSFRDQGTWKEAFFGQGGEKKLLREACPLKRNGNQYRFIHRSLLEYCLSRAVFEPQERGSDERKITEPSAAAVRRASVGSVCSFESDGLLDESIVAVEQLVLGSPLGRKSFVNEPSILRFLGERVQQESVFKNRLLAVIERSKTEKTELETVRRAAANAITILIRAGVQFNGADLQGIQIPGADLSYGAFESAQLQGADMRKAILRNVSLRGSNLSRAQMTGVQFGELPFLKEESEVMSCAYSPDGKTFAVGLADGSVCIYTTSSWEKTKTLRGHSRNVSSVLYSPRGDRVASGSEDLTVRLWDVEAGECLHTLSGHSGWGRSVAFSPKGDQIIFGSYENTILLWSVETGDCLRTLSGHSDSVRSVAYSSSGDQIASGSEDKTIRLWNVDTGDCRHILRGHRRGVLSVVYSPKGDQVASGSFDNTARLWDVATGDCRYTLGGHSGWVSIVVFSPKGDQIVSGSWDTTVRLWDVVTGGCRHTLRGHSDLVSSVVFSPAGDQIVSGSWDKTVRLWEVETGDCRHTLGGHSGCVLSVVYSPKGDQIASGSLDNTVRLWDVETGPAHHTLTSHSGHVSSVMYSPTGDQIISGSSDNTVRVWDVETGYCRHNLSGHRDSVRSVVYSPKGNQIASGSWDKTVRLWDAETGACRRTLGGHGGCVLSVVYSPKGDQIASGSSDNTVRLWDVESGNCHDTLGGHGDWVWCVAYSPDGSQVASGSEDRTVRLWDVETGDCRRTFSGHSHGVLSVMYSPKGDQLASGSEDNTIRLWDVETGDCRHTLGGHSRGGFMCLSKGNQGPSGTAKETVQPRGVAIRDYRHTFGGHHDTVSSVVYSPSGDQIASGSIDSTVRLWDVASGQCRAVIHNHAEVNSIAWVDALSGSYLVTGCVERSVRMWQVADRKNVRLHWRSPPDVLTLLDTSMQDVEGLSRLNKLLLKQRGAVFEQDIP